MLGKTFDVKQVLVVAILSEISEENVEHAKLLVEGGGVIEGAHVVLCYDKHHGRIRE